MDPVWSLMLLPLALGLLGFFEPCSLGSSLLFIKYVEGRPASLRLMQAGVFTLTRALFIGTMGGIAAVVGTSFMGFQRAGWVALGLLYLVLGLTYLTGQAGQLMKAIGPGIRQVSSNRRAATLAVLFGLNIPACAAPLLAAVLGSATLGQGAQVGRGFLMLSVFGLALSLPLVVALLSQSGRRGLDRLSAASGRVPIFIGVLLAVLGLWSIYLGLFAIGEVTP